MKNMHLKLLVILTSLVLGLVSCQMEEDVFLGESLQQEAAAKEDKDSASSGKPVAQTPAAQTPPLAEKGEAAESNKPSETQNTPPPTPDIVLGVTQVRVQFDPDTGLFYHSDGRVNSNPINVELTTGYTVSRPEAVPYREGYKFRGWVRSYPYSGLTFTEDDFWDFEKTILTEAISLYAYFEESDTPDPKPEIVAAPSSTVPDYSGNLLDLGLQPTPIPAEKLDANGRYRLFSTGVSKEGGWLNNPQYKNNCWATSAAQMIYWYQQQVEAISGFDGTERPMETTDKVLEMRNYFADWKFGQGSHISWALEKYFDDFFRPDRRQDLHRYGGNSSRYFTLETLSAILYKHLSRGDVGGICGFTFDGGNHAMNIYGAEFDRDGLVTALYITSSPTLDSEERVASHTPRLYESRRTGKLNRGSHEWVANYEYRGDDGYLRTSQHLFSRVWCLDFLSVERYK